MGRRGNGARLNFREGRNTYYIHYTDKSGKTRQQSTGTDDLEAAELALAKFNIQQGAVAPKGDGLITDVLTSYALSVEDNDEVASPERIGFALIPLIEFCGHHHVSDINPAFCKRYAQWRQRPRKVPAGKGGTSTRIVRISDGTVRRELTTLRAAVNAGSRGSEATFWLPRIPDPRPRWLRRHEAAGLLRAARRLSKARNHLSLFIVIGLWTGRRKEAILSLKWSQIDFESGMVDFRAPGTEESTKRRGIVRVPNRLLGHLRRARKCTSSEYVIDWHGDRMGDIKRSFALAVEAAGLGGDVTPHTLRHTTATWLMQKGTTPFSAAGYLSMSVETLLKVYAKFSPDFQSDVLEALS